MDLPELEMGSFQDSLVGRRKEAAGEPFHDFFYSLSLLSTAYKLQMPGPRTFEGLGFSSSKTNEDQQNKFCVDVINGRIHLS